MRHIVNNMNRNFIYTWLYVFAPFKINKMEILIQNERHLVAALIYNFCFIFVSNLYCLLCARCYRTQRHLANKIDDSTEKIINQSWHPLNGFSQLLNFPLDGVSLSNVICHSSRRITKHCETRAIRSKQDLYCLVTIT